MNDAIYTPQERSWMLALARRSVGDAARGIPTPEPAEEAIFSRLRELRACFVTLTREGRLRGCIGNLSPGEPLYRNIIANARGAALRDTRFSPVEPSELEQLRVELSVLGVPERLQFASAEELLSLLCPGVHGVVLHINSQSATFLPQVWEHIPDKEEFLNRLTEKAGWEPSAWRRAQPVVSVYRAESFGEEAKPASA